MYTKQVCLWILGLGVSIGLTVGQAPATPLPFESTGLQTTGSLVTDADLDGVDDLVDRCPGTPAGTPVDQHGCPLAVSTCDYQIGDTIILSSTGGSAGPGSKTSYVLTNAAGQLERINNTMPSFSSTGLSAGTYQAYALTYTDDNTLANLVVNGTTTLSQVSASCLAVSPPLSLTLCSCSPICVPILISRLR